MALLGTTHGTRWRTVAELRAQNRKVVGSSRHFVSPTGLEGLKCSAVYAAALSSPERFQAQTWVIINVKRFERALHE